MNNMENSRRSRCALMRKIMEYDFYIYDLNLYLDTHPDDCNALQEYQQMSAKHDELTNEYVQNYGPINARQVTSDNYWTWIESPWPWEGGME